METTLLFCASTAVHAKFQGLDLGAYVITCVWGVVDTPDHGETHP